MEKCLVRLWFQVTTGSIILIIGGVIVFIISRLLKKRDERQEREKRHKERFKERRKEELEARKIRKEAERISRETHQSPEIVERDLRRKARGRARGAMSPDLDPGRNDWGSGDGDDFLEA